MIIDITIITFRRITVLIITFIQQLLIEKYIICRKNEKEKKCQKTVDNFLILIYNNNSFI